MQRLLFQKGYPARKFIRTFALLDLGKTGRKRVREQIQNIKVMKVAW